VGQALAVRQALAGGSHSFYPSELAVTDLEILCTHGRGTEKHL